MEPSADQAALPRPGARGPGARITAPWRRALAFWRAHERYAPAFFFLAGTAWDAATIFRIDSVVDNALVVVYLAGLGTLLALTPLVDAGRITAAPILRWRPWFPAAKQFLLGALFSTFVFFYSQSASWSGTSVYLALLIVLLVGNEFAHERVASIHLDLALYFVATATFLVYFVPMVTRVMNAWTFLAATMLAALLVLALSEFLLRRGVFRTRRQALVGRAVIGALFALIQLAYANNWIPPVPMALREGGIYHEVARDGDTYRLRHERRPWYAFWMDDDRAFRRAAGEPVYCYTAVFAPTRLRHRIFHVWQFRDDAGTWKTTDRIGYEILGGRDSGYRGYTFKRSVWPGRWRVAVETEDGRLLSRIAFEVTDVDAPPADWRWDEAP